MNYNYHTHTKRCGHAGGTPEEYIQRAVENGIAYMGFSDHLPFVFPDGHESGFRVPVSEAGDYVAELSRLRETYKADIDIKIGFEMEYYPSHFSAMLHNAVAFGGEYLILGQHYIRDEHPHGIPTAAPTDRAEDLREYVSCVVAAIQSGVFTYVAHPDILHFTGDLAVYRQEMRRICVASRECAVPLEINFLGLRDHRSYPTETFWAIAGEEQAPVTFGFDAHDAPSAFDAASLSRAEGMVNKFSLNYIGMPTVVDIRDI